MAKQIKRDMVTSFAVKDKSSPGDLNKFKRILELQKRAKTGDKTAKEELTVLLDDRPGNYQPGVRELITLIEQELAN